MSLDSNPASRALPISPAQQHCLCLLGGLTAAFVAAQESHPLDPWAVMGLVPTVKASVPIPVCFHLLLKLPHRLGAWYGDVCEAYQSCHGQGVPQMGTGLLQMHSLAVWSTGLAPIGEPPEPWKEATRLAA